MKFTLPFVSRSRYEAQCNRAQSAEESVNDWVNEYWKSKIRVAELNERLEWTANQLLEMEKSVQLGPPK
jgi:hypothetical protein